MRPHFTALQALSLSGCGGGRTTDHRLAALTSLAHHNSLSSLSIDMDADWKAIPYEEFF
jgi:hypothetical protein